MLSMDYLGVLTTAWRCRVMSSCLAVCCASVVSLGADPATAPTNPSAPKPASPVQPGFNLPPELTRKQREKPAANPRARVFDPALVAEEAVKTAVEPARREHKNILIVWGEEGQSKPTDMLDNLLKLEQIRAASFWEYAVVFAEISPDAPAGKQNLAYAKRLGVPVREKGETRHAVLTAMDLDLKVLGNKPLDETIVEHNNGDYYQQFVVLPFLEGHKAPRPEAQQLMDAALTSAKENGKGVLVRFTEPWDEWSTRFAAVVDQPAVRQALESAYVLVVIDTVRNPGGIGVMNTIGGEYIEGIPYFAFLDSSGKVLARSQADPVNGKPGHNIGFPSSDEELARLAELLASNPKMSKGSVRTVVEAFRQAAVHRSGSQPAAEPANPERK